MISFGSYYNFPAKNVQYIALKRNDDKEFPYELMVFFKGGGCASITYPDRLTAQLEKENIVRQMETEENATAKSHTG